MNDLSFLEKAMEAVGGETNFWYITIGLFVLLIAGTIIAKLAKIAILLFVCFVGWAWYSANFSTDQKNVNLSTYQEKLKSFTKVFENKKTEENDETK